MDVYPEMLFEAQDEYILAGYEVVDSKAGKETYGLDRFFSGVEQRVIRGPSFFALSLVNVKEEHSYPLQISQIVKSAEEKAASYALLQPIRQTCPDYSVLDLKSNFRGCRYTAETIKMLAHKPDAILLADIFQQIARLGAIHPVFNPLLTLN
jgi:hypothetical protein